MKPEVWTPAFVGLGSNIDDPRRQVARAAARLSELPGTRLQRCSPLYRSPPLGPSGQPDFFNAVAALLTRLDAATLLAGLLELEQALGRRRDGERWGPRCIDLDLLLHGDTVLASEALTLPHPGLVSRAFVLRPLADLAPMWRLPDGRRVEQHLAAVDCSATELIGVVGET